MTCPTEAELTRWADDPSGSPEVGDHVAGCPRCRARSEVARADAALERELVDAVVGGPPAAPPAHKIPGYELEQELYRGGQGVVHAARQASTGRRVAIKVLLEGAFASERSRRRFEREVELAASIDHPHIVTVFDSGATPDGGRWLAMQLVDGVPANAIGGDRGHRLRTFAAICRAVDHAHGRGVLHRDLKPGNVLVDADGEPHVLDFGLAVAAHDDAGAEATRLTRAGEFLGTLAYASPEHARGDPAGIDVRSDVYSLGVMLYEALTGRFPYPIDGPVLDVVHAITSTAPAPPSSGRAYASATSATLPEPVGVDRDLETIVLKALAKEPERRYDTAGALARDLEAYLAGDAIEARRDSVLYLLRKAVGRHRFGTATAAAILVLVLGATAVATALWQRSEVRAAEADAIGTFFTDLLATLNPDRAAGRDVTVREFLDEAAARLDREPPDEPEVEHRLRHAIGVAYRDLRLPRPAIRQLARARELAAELWGPDSVQHAREAYAAAYAQALLGADETAVDGLRRAIDALDRHGDETLGERAQGKLGLARMQGLLMRHEDALANAERGAELGRRAFGPKSRFQALARDTLALLAMGRGDAEAAAGHARAALDVAEEVGASESAMAIALWNRLAATRAALGDAAGARQAFEQALERSERLLGAEHARSLWIRAQILPLAAALEGAEATAEELERLLALRPALLSSPTELAAWALNDLAIELQRRGDLARAAATLEDSLAFYEASLDAGTPALAQARANLAELFAMVGARDEARELARDALADLEAASPPRPGLEAHAQRVLATVEEISGDLERALVHADRAVALRAQRLDVEGGAPLAAARSYRGFLRYQARDLEGAAADLEEARVWYAAHPGLDAVEEARCLDRLGWLALERWDAAEAERRFAASLELRRDRLGDGHWEVGESLNGLALARGFLGRPPAECEELLREAVATMLPLGEGFSRTPWVLTNLGTTLLRMQRVEEATAVLADALARARRTAHAGHPLLGVTIAARAMAHTAADEQEAARPLFEEALAKLEAARGADDPQTKQVAGLLAASYRALGDQEAAERYEARAR